MAYETRRTWGQTQRPLELRSARKWKVHDDQRRKLKQRSEGSKKNKKAMNQAPATPNPTCGRAQSCHRQKNTNQNAKAPNINRQYVLYQGLQVLLNL